MQKKERILYESIVTESDLGNWRERERERQIEEVAVAETRLSEKNLEGCE